MTNLVDVSVFLFGLLAFAVGIGGALSGWWASAAVGVVVMGVVIVSRVQPGGRKQ